MLGNFFKPKWLHKDANVRIQAIASLAGDSVELIKLAQTDPDNGVRMEAVLRLSHLPTLVQLGHSAGSIGERAKQRVIGLAATDHRHDHQLADVFSWLQTNPTLLRSIARDTMRHISLRRHALETLNDQELLFDIALNDQSKEVQYLAASRLQSVEQLRTLDTKHGKTNKRLRQFVKERLELEQRQQQQLQQLNQLLAETNTLGQMGSWGQEKTRSRVLEQRWKALQATSTPAQQQQFTQTIADFRQRLADYEAEQAQAATLKAQREAEEAAKRAEAQRLAEQAQAEAQARKEREQQTQAEERRKRKEQHAQQAQRLQILRDGLQMLEQHLENEQYSEAIEQHRLFTQQLKESNDVPTTDMAYFNRRIQMLTPYIRELQDWRRWGTDQVRKQLIETAENLCEDDNIDPATRAKRVQSLRTEWRKLSHLEPGQQHTLWKTFDSTVSAAYEPSKQHFIEQAQQRQANLAARHEICAELEQLHASTDWQNAAWREVQVQTNQPRKQWKDAGTVSHKDWETVNQRFNTAMDALEAQFKAERARNWQMREQLVEQAQALLDEPSTEHAIEQVKALQGAWKITLAARHSDEQQLWKRFREPIDALFARARDERQQKRDAQQAQQAENVRLEAEKRQKERERRQQELAELAALAIQSDTDKQLDADEVTQAQHQAQGELLCMQMEILLDLETPAVFQKTRMEYQIAQMRDAMCSPKAQASPQTQALTLLKQWYTLGSMGTDAFASQTARIDTIRQAMQ